MPYEENASRKYPEIVRNIIVQIPDKMSVLKTYENAQDLEHFPDIDFCPKFVRIWNLSGKNIFSEMIGKSWYSMVYSFIQYLTDNCL